MQIKSPARRAAALLALAAQFAAAAELPLPPAEAFFLPPDLQWGQLSPSGRYISFVGGQPADVSRLTIVDTQGKTPPQFISEQRVGGFRGTRWITDDLLAFLVVRSPGIYTSGMFTVERDGSVVKPVDVDNSNVGPGRSRGSLYGLWYTLGTYGDPAHLVIEDGRVLPDGYAVVRPWEWDARKSKWSRVLKGDPPHPQVHDWLYDRQARARVAFAREGDGHVWFYNMATTSDAEDRWREMGRWATGDRPYGAVELLPDGRLGVTVPNTETGWGEFREFDLETRRPKDKVLVSVPGFDANVSAIIDAGRLAGYYVQTEDWQTAWQLPAMKALQQKVDEMLPGRINFLRCVGCATAESVLLHSYSDRTEGEFLHYNGKTGEWRRLGSKRGALDENRMGRTQLLRVAARDGLELPVWVTLPAGVPPTGLKTVVRVHDGPWQRGRSWGFEAESQFLASRGYLVIEPEFRGSKGYGDKLYQAGMRQWGERMQDDLVDALAAVVAKGWADPKRVCIAGEGYGGYATLMALARQGDVFRCGIAAGAISDLPAWLEMDTHTEERAWVGDPKVDGAALAAKSPRRLAAQIKAPLLLAHSDYDGEVPIEQGTWMRDALTAAGRPPQWVLYPDEGHRRTGPKNQTDFWQRVERFLDQNLKQ